MCMRAGCGHRMIMAQLRMKLMTTSNDLLSLSLKFLKEEKATYTDAANSLTVTRFS